MTHASVSPETMALAAGFPEHTREDWQRLVAAVLNKRRAEGAHLDGPAAEQALRRHLEGGLEVDGLYLRQDRPLGVPGAMPFTLTSGASSSASARVRPARPAFAALYSG